MAAMLHVARHLQYCQPCANAPSTLQPMLVHAECRPCCASTTPCHQQQRRRDVAVLVKGRRATGDTLSEQLADLLPEHSGIGAQEPQQREPRRKQGRQQKQRNEKAEEVEDVEIFSIDSGWAADAFDNPAKLDELLAGSAAGRSSTAALDSAAADSSSDADGTEASSMDELEATWAAAAAEAEAMLASARGGAGSEEAWAIDGGGVDDGETEWTTDNYEFDSDDEEEADVSSGAQVPLAEDDDGWMVSAVPGNYSVERASQGSAGMREPQVGSALRQLLDSMPPEMARRLAVQDEDAAAEERATDPREVAKATARRRTHRKLRIISGTAGGKRLISPQGDTVRPMMEMVRAAVFSMIHARTGSVARLPEGSRWLDLFAGTGSIGLEALSRGCKRATFVELDPWVTQRCLQPNIDSCELRSGASVITTKAEAFLQRAAAAPGYGGGPFDFISVCPPYLLVSYPELFQLLEASPLTKPTSIILVEYPKRLAHEIPDTLCGLPKVRDRKYGRTFLALFAPEDPTDAEDDMAWQSYV